MTVAEWFSTDSRLRYLLRDGLKTRYTDAQLLVHFNAAVKKVAEDTLYYHGIFELRVTANKTAYGLDPRIIKVKGAYIDGCKTSILTNSNTCSRQTSETTISNLYVDNSATRNIHVYPMLTNPVKPNREFIGAGLRYIPNQNQMQAFGVQMVFDAVTGLATPVLADPNYVPVALHSIYRPEPMTLDTIVSDTTIDLLEVINMCVQMLVTEGSSVTTTMHLNKEAEREYVKLTKKFRAIQSGKYADADSKMPLKGPFTGSTTRRHKDF